MRKGPWLLTFMVFALVLVTTFFWYRTWYWPAALLLLGAALLPFYARFEGRRVRAEEIVLLAELAAIAAVVRIPFAAIPSVQPTSFIIMMAGLALGSERGFLTGSMAALVSNIFLGQGPWTPWQMFAFGIIGFISAIVFQKRKYLAYNKVVLCVYGFIMTFVVYGLILDTATVFMYTDRPKISSFMSTYAMGIPFNIVHGIATVVFLLLLAKPLFNKLSRMKEKYGMYNKKNNLN